ncbi:MAG: hypothetical protein HZA72_03170 [Candidatus Omnitrophica bacterium]|nr:hypothetical protein [Candidatus Omnitrophota bacterium]
MKRYILASILLTICSNTTFAEDVSRNPQQLFYKGNALYEKREYEKAGEEYAKMLEEGFESGPLYYNIGNAFFKMGKTGYAILAYKKAERLTPGDSDLKSNLSYAESLTEDSSLQGEPVNKFVWLVKIPFKEMSINNAAAVFIILYLILMALMILGIISPVFKRKATFIFYIVLILFVIALAGFSVRYYEEEVLTHGIVVAKEAECKYEPIDKSTTYFKLKEGQEVLVLKTRNGWRRIKRLDGKLAWVKADAVEEID